MLTADLTTATSFGVSAEAKARLEVKAVFKLYKLGALLKEISVGVTAKLMRLMLLLLITAFTVKISWAEPIKLAPAQIGFTAEPMRAEQLQLSPALTMRQLILEVLNNYPSISEANFVLDAAGSAERSAFWQFFPTPSVSFQQVNASKTDASYRGGDRQTVLSLYQPLWTGGRLSSSWDKAKAGITLNQANLQSVRLNVALLYVEAYGEWFDADLKIKALQRSLATHKKLIAMITRRINVGLSAASDLLLSEARISAVESALQQAKAQSVAAKIRLMQLQGRPLEASALQQLNTQIDFKLMDQSLMVASALAVSPDIAKVTADVRVAKAEIGIQRANFSPELYVKLDRQYGNISYNTNMNENRLFFGLSTALGAGLSLFNQVDQAHARHRAAEAKLETLQRQVTEQVLTDVANFESAQERLVRMQASFIAYMMVTESWDRQFFAGRKSWVELMNAAQELAQSELAVANQKALLLVLKWRLAIQTRGLEQVLLAESASVEVQ